MTERIMHEEKSFKTDVITPPIKQFLGGYISVANGLLFVVVLMIVFPSLLI